MQKIILAFGLLVLIGVPLSQAQTTDALNARFDNAHNEREAFSALIQADKDANVVRRFRYRQFQSRRDQERLDQAETGKTKLTLAQRIRALRDQQKKRTSEEQSITDRLTKLRTKIAEQTTISTIEELDPSIFNPLPEAALQEEAERAAKKRSDLRRLQRMQEARVGRFSRSETTGGLSNFKALRRAAFERSLRER